MSGASGLYDRLEKDMESEPGPDSPAFASALHARLEHIEMFGFFSNAVVDPV